MVLTLKVISASMCYQDGLVKEEDLRVSQRKNLLKELPSLTQYLGYCLNCGTHLAGPVYEIRDYIDWTEDKGVPTKFFNLLFISIFIAAKHIYLLKFLLCNFEYVSDSLTLV